MIQRKVNLLTAALAAALALFVGVFVSALVARGVVRSAQPGQAAATRVQPSETYATRPASSPQAVETAARTQDPLPASVSRPRAYHRSPVRAATFTDDDEIEDEKHGKKKYKEGKQSKGKKHGKHERDYDEDDGDDDD